VFVNCQAKPNCENLVAMDQTTGMILEFENDNQQVSDNTVENNEPHIICRICYDGMYKIYPPTYLYLAHLGF